MASGKSSKAMRNARASVVSKRSVPWGTIAAVLVVVLFAGAVFGYAVFEGRSNTEQQSALAAFSPSAENKDPSTAIPGVVVQSYQGGQHTRTPEQQVAYTQSPPFGGAHSEYWAACTGVVYEQPVRNENIVHSLEHGAVWIAYDPAVVTGDALEALRQRVQGEPYMLLTPYPGLDAPISLQSWGHQLKVTDANDPRIDQFIQALRRNPYTHPEVGASCVALGPGLFDQDNPPPPDAAPPGPNALPERGVPGAAPAPVTGG